MPQRPIDSTDAALAAHSAADSLAVMMEMERTSSYACSDYLGTCRRRGRSGTNHSKVTADDRLQIVDWCYEIVDRCGFKRETVAVAMNLVDRFMSHASHSTRPEVQGVLHDRAEYQLVAVGSLYISIKLHERAFLGSADFSVISGGLYTREDIESMELRMLHGLSWRLSPPTSLQVSKHILALMLPLVSQVVEQDTLRLLEEEVAYMSENSVRDYDFATQRPSTVAAAALINSIEQLSECNFKPLMEALVQVLQGFGFDSPRALLETRFRLRHLVNKNEEGGGTVLSEGTTRDVQEGLQEDQVRSSPERRRSRWTREVKPAPRSATTSSFSSDDSSSCARTIYPSG